MRLQLYNNRSFLVVFLATLYFTLQIYALVRMTRTDDLEEVSIYSKAQLTPQGGIQLETPIDLEEEIRKNLDYAKSIPDTERKLIFVHIPKTAGTTIEEVGAYQAKSAPPWGSCLFNHRPKRRCCKYPPGQFVWPTKIGYWHLPTQIFPLMGTNPYEAADLFAVVRHPNDRLLSEFYYICRRKITRRWDGSDCNRTRIMEPTYMNEWLRKKLSHTRTSRLSEQDYLYENGHFTPQYDFIVANGNIRMVDYVLRMDNLQSEFPALMNAYGLNAALPERKGNAAHDDSDLQAVHFENETKVVIHDKYGHDLELFKKVTK